MTATPDPEVVPPDVSSARRAVAEVPLWYHTMELAPSVVTPGWFDLRPRVDVLPWPELAGARCLDLATWDGFFAFTMERAGAAAVVATDIEDHADWDWMIRARESGVAAMAGMAGQKGRGFEVARELLRSQVERRFINVYDLSPDRVGSFDVVVLGSLLLHLRDPLRALEAVRSVCDGWLLSIEPVDLATSVLHPRRPLLFIEGRNGRWTLPNTAGHRQLLHIAGFDLEEQTLLDEPLGAGHPAVAERSRQNLRRRATDAVRRLRFGGTGMPTSAVRCRPS
ncbi:MAG: class I SAM-dependent methyltransferase [Actinobacteria bacterium]|nr:class I SAM-dependent methyltransferase [Actinomycetota bacterium]